jgi:hypothetical protein
MTNQKAIEILKTERNHMIPTLLPERIEAMNMAISAFEKQIPQKPNNCIWYSDGSAMGHCPMCDTFLDSDSDAHCPGCGQAILWSEGD